MSELFRFPELSRDDPHSTLAQRLSNSYEKGVAQGYEQGLAEGKQQAKEEVEKQLREEFEGRAQQHSQQVQQQTQQHLDALIIRFQQRLQLEEKRLSSEIAELVNAISKAVLDAELSLNPQHYLRAVEQVLENLHGRDQIECIQVSEADGQWLQTQNISQIGGVEISIDESLPAGQVQFSGQSKLHLWSFSQRLEDVLTQIKPILTGEHAD